jgi:hypothetical protein
MTRWNERVSVVAPRGAPAFHRRANYRGLASKPADRRPEGA